MSPSSIKTERLSLEPWVPADAPELRALLDGNDAHLRPWIPFMRHEPRDLDGTRGVIEECAASFAKGEHLRFGIRTLAGGELVGEAMLIDRGEPECKELGYWLAQSATGRGYATEASTALLALAFEGLGLPRIEIVCDLENRASIRVAERLGGRLEREFEEGEGDDICRCGVFVVTRGSGGAGSDPL